MAITVHSGNGFCIPVVIILQEKVLFVYQMIKSRKRYQSVIGELILFFTGIILFTYLARQKGLLFFLSFSGLILSASVVAMHAKSWHELNDAFGLKWIKGLNLYFIPLSILAAIFFSLLYRRFLSLDLFPQHIISFAIVAALIGATEELIFRGYIQSRSREFGIILSILIAASTHTVYKYVLFSSLSAVQEINMGFLVFWTMTVGLILGIMKEYSGSSYVPILFHVVFDILVYGDGTIEPWWVFG